MSEITEQILFSGNVQGVGFRWTTARIASGLPLRGFVRNLPDRRVEIIVVGTTDCIQQLIDVLRERFGSGITDVQRTTLAASNDFVGFDIR